MFPCLLNVSCYFVISRFSFCRISISSPDPLGASYGIQSSVLSGNNQLRHTVTLWTLETQDSLYIPALTQLMVSWNKFLWIFTLYSDSSIHSFIVFNLQFNSADDDYKGLFKTLEFGVGVTSMQVNLQIYDDEFRPKVEGDESFSVLLRNSRNGKLSATHSKAVVTIHDLENDGKNIIVKKLRYSLFFDKNIKWQDA